MRDGSGQDGAGQDGAGRWQMLALLFILRTAMAFQFQVVGAL